MQKHAYPLKKWTAKADFKCITDLDTEYTHDMAIGRSASDQPINFVNAWSVCSGIEWHNKSAQQNVTNNWQIRHTVTMNIFYHL